MFPMNKKGLWPATWFDARACHCSKAHCHYEGDCVGSSDSGLGHVWWYRSFQFMEKAVDDHRQGQPQTMCTTALPRSERFSHRRIVIITSTYFKLHLHTLRSS